jgi:hypothetical protein
MERVSATREQNGADCAARGPPASRRQALSQSELCRRDAGGPLLRYAAFPLSRARAFSSPINGNSAAISGP